MMRVKSVLAAFARSGALAALVSLPPGIEARRDAIEIAPMAGKDFDNHVFVAGQPVTLRVRVDDGGSTASIHLGYDVRDADDRSIARGEVVTTDDPSHGRTAELVQLPSGVGWYQVVFNASDRPLVYAAEVHDGGGYLTYAVVPRPRAKRRESSPFGIDTAIGSSRTLDARQSIRLAQLAGVGWIRERISLALTFPGPDRHVFEPTLTYAKAARAAGLSVLQVFNDAPKWIPRVDDQRIPGDLRVVHDMAQALGAAFEGHVAAWEIWNEHDIAHFSGSTPDRYAAFLKAFALGLRAHGHALRVLGPFARDPTAGGYDEVLFGAGVADYLDVYSIHDYRPIERGGFQRIVDQHVGLADQAGFRGKPMWMTETGRPVRSSHRHGALAAALAQADYAVKSFVLGRAGGLERVFWFLLRPYPSKVGEFGIFRHDLTPQPYYQAIAMMAHTLGEARYVGQVMDGHAQVHLFDDGRERVAVVWAESPTVLRLLGATAAARVIDRLGQERPAEVTDGGLTVRVEASPVYVRGVRWAGVPNGVTPKSRPKDAAPPRDLSVILGARVEASIRSATEAPVVTDYDGLTSDWSPRAYALARTSKRVTLEVFNFSDVEKSCALDVEASPGLAVDRMSLAVVVEPRSSATASVRLGWTDDAVESSAVLKISGKANDVSLSPALLRFVRQ